MPENKNFSRRSKKETGKKSLEIPKIRPQIFFISILTQMNTSISYFNTFPIFFPYIFVRPLVFIFSVLLILSKIPLDYNINL